MATYVLIGLGVLGYATLGTLAAYLYARYSDDYIAGTDSAKLAAIYICWPVLLLISILIAPVALVEHITRKR